MRRLIAVLFLCGLARAGAAPLQIATWNLNSGVASEAVSSAEQNRLANIATVLNELNADVIALQEIRDRQTCERLARMLGPARYEVAVCSAFADDSGRPLPQVAILSRKPVTAAWAERWKGDGAITPPGGFAFALIHRGAGDVGFFTVNLKNNATNDDLERDAQLNILNREVSAAQLVRQAAALGTKLPERPSAVVMAGSFNTNPDEPEFVSENTLRVLEGAGFRNLFRVAPRENRITWRGDGRYSDATADYVFARNAGFLAGPRIIDSELSGHFPVVCAAVVRPTALAGKTSATPQAAARGPMISMALFVALLLFSWWWALGRKQFYSAASAALVAADGSENLLGFPEGNTALADSRGTVDDFDMEDRRLPARARIQSLQERVADAERRAKRAAEVVRSGLVPHLADLMKDKLFRGVASQRAQLLRSQHSGASQVAELEQRLARIQLQVQNRFSAYERRIAELEREVAAKEQVNRELLNAKVQKLKPALEGAQIRERNRRASEGEPAV